jgi:hypothetical protein
MYSLTVGAPSHGRASLAGLWLCLSAALSAPASSQDAYAGIFGQAADSATVGQLYVFQPHVVVDAGTPTFEVWNKPAWLAFDLAEGWLIGEPAAADQGFYPGIKVCMTVGGAQSCLPEFSIQVNAPQPRATTRLSWQSPVENGDGSALTDLAGFVVYSGPTAEQLMPVAFLPSPALNYLDMSWLQPGQHYFAVTAYNSLGLESEKTNVVMKRIE